MVEISSAVRTKSYPWQIWSFQMNFEIINNTATVTITEWSPWHPVFLRTAYFEVIEALADATAVEWTFDIVHNGSQTPISVSGGLSAVTLGGFKEYDLFTAMNIEVAEWATPTTIYSDGLEITTDGTVDATAGVIRGEIVYMDLS
jgi:hypothetical protein